jgi:hypothetical protein
VPPDLLGRHVTSRCFAQSLDSQKQQNNIFLDGIRTHSSPKHGKTPQNRSLSSENT